MNPRYETPSMPSGSEALSAPDPLDPGPTIRKAAKGAQRLLQGHRGVTYSVYIHARGRKPVLVGEVTGRVPATYKVDDKVYHWVGADLSAKTLTYSDFRAAPATV